MKNALIIGGTSGLGLDLAKLLKKDHNVIATGRRLPEIDGIEFIEFDLSKSDDKKMAAFVTNLPTIDTLCIAAGFFQEGNITEISENDIDEMIDVGLRVPAILIRKILDKQKEIPVFIPVTSTSQWTPRLKEPIYTAIKGGFGMLTNSLSLDPRIKKTLLVAPAGMKTRFWEKSDMDTKTFLDSKWVAEQIIGELKDTYSYKFIRVLREPPRVEIIEVRK